MSISREPLNYGMLYKNKEGRYQVVNSGMYFTCGDAIYVCVDGTYMPGRVEHDGHDYYFLSERCPKIYLCEDLEIAWQ